MLLTPMGNILITCDGFPVSYTALQVRNPRLFPDVDGAWLLRIPYTGDGAARKRMAMTSTGNI